MRIIPLIKQGDLWHLLSPIAGYLVLSVNDGPTMVSIIKGYKDICSTWKGDSNIRGLVRFLKYFRISLPLCKVDASN